MKSYLSHLECSQCGATCSSEKPQRVCPACGKVLLARYDLEGLRRSVEPKTFSSRAGGMWRYFELLPVRDEDNIVSLGEGGTPLLKARNLGRRLGVEALYIKEEGLNPTGTFKARGLSAAVSRAVELGVRRFVMPSAGNAGGALAAYAARAGLEAHLFMPRDAPEANRKECAALGAHLTLVEGHIGDAGRAAGEKAATDGLFDLSTLKEPYRLEGKKTMGLELAQDLGWKMPDVIVYPTGGGTGIIGMWKAFREMLQLGWVEGPLPRFVVIQSSGCQPIVRAFQRSEATAQPWADPETIAQGLKVPAPFADYLILQVLRETGGTALAVEDREIVTALKEMASLEGVFACPEGAATLAGLRHLLEGDFLQGDETIVLLNTGSGMKYLDVLSG